MKDPRAAILRELIADGWAHEPIKGYYFRLTRGGQALVMYAKGGELLRGAYGAASSGVPGLTESGLLSQCLTRATRVQRLGMHGNYRLSGIGWRDTTGLHVELALHLPGVNGRGPLHLNVWADSGSLPGLVVLGAWDWLNSAPEDNCGALIDAILDAVQPIEVKEEA